MYKKSVLIDFFFDKERSRKKRWGVYDSLDMKEQQCVKEKKMKLTNHFYCKNMTKFIVVNVVLRYQPRVHSLHNAFAIMFLPTCDSPRRQECKIQQEKNVIYIFVTFYFMQK
jgi:hypothetical protein